jgi:phytoene/squalene synthetase
MYMYCALSLQILHKICLKVSDLSDCALQLQAWSQFADELTDFKLEEKRAEAVHCLNLLITNALHHVPDVLKYMARIKNQSIFNFCAIPQVTFTII